MEEGAVLLCIAKQISYGDSADIDGGSRAIEGDTVADGAIDGVSGDLCACGAGGWVGGAGVELVAVGT